MNWAISGVRSRSSDRAQHPVVISWPEPASLAGSSPGPPIHFPHLVLPALEPRGQSCADVQLHGRGGGDVPVGMAEG